MVAMVTITWSQTVCRGCQSVKLSACVCVCVFYMLNSQDQKNHLTCNVRTFWLVLTKVCYRVKNWFGFRVKVRVGFRLT